MYSEHKFHRPLTVQEIAFIIGNKKMVFHISHDTVINIYRKSADSLVIEYDERIRANEVERIGYMHLQSHDTLINAIAWLRTMSLKVSPNDPTNCVTITGEYLTHLIYAEIANIQALQQQTTADKQLMC